MATDINRIMATMALRVTPDRTALDNLSQKLADESRKLSKLAPADIAALYPDRCTCRYCGDLMLPYWRDGWKSGQQTLVFPDWHGCEAEMLADETRREQETRQATERAEAEHAAALERAGLVGWLATATFETFGRRLDWKDAAQVGEQATTYADMLTTRQLVDRNWLVLCGNYGTGKTHLAAAVLHRAIDAGWPAVRFRVWTDYLLRIQKSYNNHDPEAESEADIVRELQTGSLIVIDDLDKRRSEFTRRTLFSVLNHRYNAKAPTILTFNFTPTDPDPLAPGRLALQDFLGAAVLDRLTERAWKVIEFNGPSFRSGAILTATGEAG